MIGILILTIYIIIGFICSIAEFKWNEAVYKIESDSCIVFCFVVTAILWPLWILYYHKIWFYAMCNFIMKFPASLIRRLWR